MYFLVKHRAAFLVNRIPNGLTIDKKNWSMKKNGEKVASRKTTLEVSGAFSHRELKRGHFYVKH